MSTIDEKVVKASFDNAEFLKNVQGTLDSLERLNKGLKLQGATKGLTDLGSASKNVNISHIADGVDAIKSKFSAMSVVGIAAMASLATKAVDTGLRVVKAFTFDPITAGFRNYETQINAVQTILANTGLKGSAGLQQVTNVLDNLNEYANKTVYNFAEMAQNIGTFTAAGVKLEPAANAIKGIANLAALSGANSQQASMAMYQLSQAIAANKVGLQDWNSVVNAGLGGKVFQEALFNTAKQLHTIKNVPMGQTFQQWTDAGNSFRGSLQQGWITGKVLTDTLSQFTGDLTDAQLKSMGYNDEQIKQIQELAKTANNAATQIKTFHQMMDALKEEVASAWGAVFKTLFGDINGAIGLFTPLHNVLQNLLTGPVYSLNKVLQGWVAFGGKVKLLDAIKTAFKDLHQVIAPIKDAFNQVFPGNAVVTLLKLTKAFDDLVHRFHMSADTATNLRRTFAGVFALFDIGWQVIKQVAHFIGDLIGAVAGPGTHGILSFTGSLGDFIVALDNSLKHGEGLRNFFLKLEAVLKPVIAFIGNIVGHLGELATVAGPVIQSAFGKVGDFIQHIGDILGPISDKLQDFFHNMFKGVSFDGILKVFSAGFLGGILVLIKRFSDKFKGGDIFGSLVHEITQPFHSLTETLESMQKTLRATTLLEIATAVGVLTFAVIALSKINAQDLAKALTAITAMFAQLTAAMAIMTKIGGVGGLVTTSAGLVLFATAIDVLASAVKKMGDLSWTEIAKGLTATTVLIVGLTAAARGMSGAEGGMVRAGASLLLLAAAIKVLDDSVKDFATMDWGQIAKGLTGVAALLASLALFTKFSDASNAGIASGAGLVLLAGAIKVLASAAQDFASMSWGGITKGLVTITAILGAFVLFSKGVGNPGTLLAAGASLVAISVAMTVLAQAMQEFGKMSWGELAKGLVSMAGALLLIVAALNALPPSTLLSAGALVAVSFALTLIGKSLEGMGQQSWSEVAKGLVTLAGALTILAAACYVMEGALPGAAAILVVAAALVPLSAALKVMGSMSWGDIIKSLTELAGAFVVIGVAGLVLTPVVPILLALGAALTLMGVAVAATGAGVFLFGIGLTALATSGAAAAGAITLVVKALVDSLVIIAKGMADLLVAMAAAIAKAAPQILKMTIVLLDTFLSAIQTEGPKILNTFMTLIGNLLSNLVKNVPKFTSQMLQILLGFLQAIQKQTGPIVNAFLNIILSALSAIAKKAGDFTNAAINLLVKFLEGIARKVGDVAKAGADIVIAFIKGISDQGVRIANAALDAIVKFVNGLANAIDSHNGELRAAGGRLAAAIADGMSFGLTSKIGDLASKAASMGGSIIDAAKHKLGIHSPSKVFMQLGQYVTEGFALGIQGGSANVVNAFHNLNVDLEAQIKDAKSDVDKYSKQLWILASAQHQNAGAIYLTSMALQSAKIQLYATTLAQNDLNTAHKAQYTALQNLGKAYDALSPKLADANQKLLDAKKIRDDFAASTKDQFNVLPDIASDTSLEDFTNTLTYQVADLKKFTDVLTQLRGLGLNDALYKQLLAKGPASLQFAEQLLAGGSTAVKSLDSLSDQLTSAAGSMGTAAGTALYQAGVDAAQGLVDGLVKQQDAIKAQMKVIADQLVGVLKKELGIQSPSRVMRGLGEFVTQGLAQGLRGAAPEVEAATKFVGDTAVESMRKALSGAGDLINDSVDVNPVIAPVVDLTNVAKSTAELNAMLANKQLTIDASVTSAKDASAGYLANKLAAAEAVATDGTVAPVNVSFTQNNNSPKALSSAEIYRQTNNQLSRVKGALTTSAAPTAVGPQ